MIKIDILTYIVIIVFSLVIFMLIGSIIFKKYLPKDKIVVGSKLFLYLGFIGITTFFSTLLLINDFNKESLDPIETKKQTDDFLIKMERSKIIRNELKRDSIFNLINNYYETSCNRDIEKIKSFFVFPMEKYYTYVNVSKEKYTERTLFAWRHNEAKRCIVNRENTDIKFSHDTTIVTILISEDQTKTICTKIKLNKDLKFFWIGDVILTNYYEPDSTKKKKSRIIH